MNYPSTRLTLSASFSLFTSLTHRYTASIIEYLGVYKVRKRRRDHETSNIHRWSHGWSGGRDGGECSPCSRVQAEGRRHPNENLWQNGNEADDHWASGWAFSSHLRRRSQGCCFASLRSRDKLLRQCP